VLRGVRAALAVGALAAGGLLSPAGAGAAGVFSDPLVSSAFEGPTCTATWDGGASTSRWHDPANWTGDRLPGPSDSACIPAEAPAEAVALEDGVETLLVALDSQKPLTMSAGDLRVGGSATISRLELVGGLAAFGGATTVGSLELVGGELSGPGEVRVTGRFDWLGGVQWGSGTTLVADTATMRIGGSGAQRLNRRTLRNEAVSTLTPGGGMTLEAGGRLLNRGQLVLDGEGSPDAAFAFVQDEFQGFFDNEGIFSVERGATVLMDATFQNRSGGSVQLLSGGTLQLQRGSGEGHGGEFLLEDGASRLLVAAGGSETELLSGSSIVGDGTLAVESPVTMSGRLDLRRVELGGLLAVAAATATVRRLEQTGGKLSGAAELLVTERLDWSGGTQSGPGTTVVPDTATMHVGGGGSQRLAGRTLRNDAVSTLAPGSGVTLEDGGSLINRGSLTLDGAGNGSAAFVFASGGTTGSLLNEGILTAEGGATMLVQAPFENRSGASAQLLSGGTLQLQGGSPGGHSGEFVLGDSGTLLLFATSQPETDLLAGSSVVGPGTVALESAVDVAGSLDVGRLEVSDGGDLRLESASAKAGAVTNSGRLAVGPDTALEVADGSYEQQAGHTRLNGAGSKLVMREGNVKVSGGSLRGPGTIDGSLVNGARVELGDPPGILRITHDYAQTDAGALEVEVGDQADANRLDVDGAASLAGTLEVHEAEGSGVSETGVDVVRAGARDGRFHSLRAPSEYDVKYLPDRVVVLGVCGGAGAGPSFESTRNLSTSPGHSKSHAVARGDDATYVVWHEEGRGLAVQKLPDSGEQPTAFSGFLRGPGGGGFHYGEIYAAASGKHVYVAWLQDVQQDVPYSYETPELWFTASHDGGVTFATPRVVSEIMGRPMPVGFDTVLAASGEHVSLLFREARYVHLGSADGGATFERSTFDPLGNLEPTERTVQRSASYDLAVSGTRVYVVGRRWRRASGGPYGEFIDYADVHAYRSDDSGATFSGLQVIKESGEQLPSEVDAAAAGDSVHVSWSALTEWFDTPAGRQAQPHAFFATSQDGGASFAVRDFGRGREPRVVADRNQAYALMQRFRDEIPVGWRQEYVAARSSDGGPFGEIGAFGRDMLVWDDPSLAASGARFYAAWVARPSGRDRTTHLFLASSKDGSSLDVSTVSTCGELPRAVAPQVTASEENVALVWMGIPRGLPADQEPDNVEIYGKRGLVKAPDVAVEEVGAVQAPRDADRLAAGKPTLVRAVVRSTLPSEQRVRVRYNWKFATATGGRRDEVREEVATIRTGRNDLVLPLNKTPIHPAAGTLELAVMLDPGNEIAESDEANNRGERRHPVLETEPRKLLVVPIVMEGETLPTCDQVRAVANGGEAFMDAAFPVSPEELDVDVDCSAPLRLPQERFAPPPWEVFEALERKAWVSDYDEVVGVPRNGWFEDFVVGPDGTRSRAIAQAPYDSMLDTSIVESRHVAGWILAHEWAHNEGWVPEDDGRADPAHPMHLDAQAPGYWVRRGEQMSGKRDFMYFEAEGVTGDPLFRWIGKDTWDYLLDAFSDDSSFLTGAGDGEPEPVLALSGLIQDDGSVQSGPWYALTAEPDIALGANGELVLAYLDASGNELARTGIEVSREASEADGAGASDSQAGAFSAMVPDVPGTQTYSLRRGDEVVLERHRSASAPSVRVTAPNGGEKAKAGRPLTVSWEASDGDGDPLTYSVSLSLDGGASWRPLGEETTATAMTVHVAREHVTSQALVKVTATDGLNSGEDRSDAVFTIDPKVRNGRLAFSRGGNIWTMNPDGSDLRRLTDVYPKTGVARWTQPSWSPDGKQIVFVNEAEIGGRRSFWTMNHDGTDQRMLYHRTDRTLSCPEWSPDGASILFEVRGTHEIWVMDADGTDARRLRTSTVQVPGERYCPAWSPDGTQIAFIDAEPPQTGFTRDRDVFVMNADGSSERQVTDERIPAFSHYYGGVQRWYVAWSPDGGEIAFHRQGPPVGGGGYYELDERLWAVRLDGTGLRALTDDGNPEESVGALWLDRQPTWSPDGASIAFTRLQRAGTSPTGIYVKGAHEPPDAAQRITSPTGSDVDDQADWGPLPDPEPSYAPIVDTGGPYTVAEGSPLTLDASASSPGDEPIAGYAWDLDGDGAYEDATGPRAEFVATENGSFDVGVKVTDTGGQSATGRIEVTVTNAAPRLSDAAGSRDEARVATMTAELADPGRQDSHRVVVDWGDGSAPRPAELIAQGRTTLVRAGHTYAEPGAYAATLTATDDDGASSAVTLLVEHEAPNQAPILADSTATTREDVPLGLPLAGTDPEGLPLTYEVVDPPDHGEATPRRGGRGEPDVAYVPTEDFSGTDSFTVVASDGRHQSQPATVTVTVDPVNDRPVALAVPEVDADGPVEIDLRGDDAEDSPLTAQIVEPPAHGTVVAIDATKVIFTPDPGYHGPDAFRFRVSDGELKSDTVAVAIAVSSGNRPPVSSAPRLATDEDAALEIALPGEDPDGDALSWEILDGPQHGRLGELTGNTVAYTPLTNYHGADRFTFRVSDGQLSTGPVAVEIDVRPVNDAPVAFPASAETAEDGMMRIELRAADIDGDALTRSIIDAPAHGRLGAIEDGAVGYTPGNDYSGPDSFRFAVSDGQADSAPAVVSLTIAPVNDPPSAGDARFPVPYGGTVAVRLDVLTGDLETAAGALDYEIVDGPAKGKVVGSGPLVSYTAGAGVSGLDSFSYRVVDRGDPDGCTGAAANCSPPRASGVAVVLLDVADPPSVSLAPLDAVNTVATRHSVTATVKDPRTGPVPDALVRFTVRGAVATSGDCATASDGTCPFTYTGPDFPGIDTISAYADTNGDGDRDSGEPVVAEEATTDWVLPTAMAGHITGGGQIWNAARTDRIAFGLSAKGDGNSASGHCNVEDHATRTHVKCLDVDVISRSGHAAVLYGDATVNGMTTSYRIDVTDNGEPGSADVFSIKTASGYTADGTLERGNVQVR
jgi:Tol biopolymer transport system component